MVNLYQRVFLLLFTHNLLLNVVATDNHKVEVLWHYLALPQTWLISLINASLPAMLIATLQHIRERQFQPDKQVNRAALWRSATFMLLLGILWVMIITYPQA